MTPKKGKTAVAEDNGKLRRPHHIRKEEMETKLSKAREGDDQNDCQLT